MPLPPHMWCLNECKISWCVQVFSLAKIYKSTGTKTTIILKGLKNRWNKQTNSNLYHWVLTQYPRYFFSLIYIEKPLWSCIKKSPKPATDAVSEYLGRLSGYPICLVQVEQWWLSNCAIHRSCSHGLVHITCATR